MTGQTEQTSIRLFLDEHSDIRVCTDCYTCIHVSSFSFLLADSRRESHQLLAHGHFILVNCLRESCPRAVCLSN